MDVFKTGVVLSGGGVRGFAHLGFMKGLNEKGIDVDIYSGVSAGAIASVFLADGYSPEEAFELFKKSGIFNYSKVQWPVNGLLSLDGLKQMLNKNLSTDKLEELKHPVVLGVSNLNSGKMEFRSEGNLSDWVIATASIPVLFSPTEVEGQLYADGGLLDNLPASAIRGRCRNVIGVNVSPIHHETDLGNLIKIAIRTFQISVDVTSRNGRALCDLYVEPSGIEQVDLLDTKSADKSFALGYKAAQALTETDLKRLAI